MLENINNILEKIKSIQDTAKRFESIKPEAVKEFENMYNEMYSKQTNNTNNKVDNKSINNKIHPYLEKNKEDKNIENIETVEDKNKILNRTEKINDAISISSKKYKVSEDLIKAVIRVESSYNPYGVSKAGAMGLMQLMPNTVLKMNIEKPFDIYENIDAGTHYLKMMLDRYDGDLEKALAAYNAGPNSVDEADGIPDIEETINYVDKIKKMLFK